MYSTNTKKLNFCFSELDPWMTRGPWTPLGAPLPDTLFHPTF